MKSWELKVIAGSAILASAACAGSHPGDITNWLTNPATGLAEEVRENFWFTLMLIMPFLLLAEGLLIYVIFKFRKKPGREPAKFYDNPKLEIAWTIAPAITLVFIAVSTYSLVEKINYSPESDLQIELTAQRFFWKYHYPEYGLTIAEEPLVVPENKVVTLLGTSVDVIHSWWVPAFGVKRDLLPGRITEAWFKARRGTYKGQCAELCGPLHAEMLIDVYVVSEDEFLQWVNQRKAQNATPAAADSTSKVETQM
ncbi:MAG TPA: cytochrome c oxidase subunit II [Candidatus Glassbacteria bacterium]|nr:cytochrome c oxidase subunit II [Candidatus Glassbacteria bacterium]